ncbi:hypothetical protein RJ640_008638 [Escallonia rubra]|uniref:Myb-like domain-containing protein n=1 Tax=Escallonia rubra TaxID=112253 RepID=A0AA88R935_9ASTE|nr:hypothetical protein RJ640_008638 [Escallonia rubra]
MDDTEDDARYPPSQYGMNQGYGSSQRPKLPVRNVPYPQHFDNQYAENDEEEGEDEEVDEEEDDGDDHNNEVSIIQQNGEGAYDDEDNDDDDDGNEDDVDEDEDDDGNQHDYSGRIQNVDQKHQKKRKLKSLLSSYEFAPRVPAPSAIAAPPPKPSFGGRNPLADWTEHETFILLDAWGDRFLQRGRKSLRSEEWQEVAEKVSQESKIDRTDTQCRNRLDTLKKKYKKEKLKLAGNRGAISKWVYFKKMDMLISASSQQAGLSCGVDSGDYAFVNPRVYVNRANGLDEMRDSPGNSVSAEGEDDDSDLLPPKRIRNGGDGGNGGSFRLLADSIQKFSDIYQKIENSKRQQMVELEKMRMDFHRDLELQKRQILERAQAELVKIRQEDDEENDVSAENVSG